MGLPGLLAYLNAFVLAPFTAVSGGRNDLDVYLRAAAAMGSGHDPYADFASVTRHVDPTLTGGYIYPPGLAWYLQPLAAMPRAAAHVLVAMALQVLLVGAIVAILWAVGPVPWRGRAAIGVMTIGFFPLWQNLDYQQVNLLLLALSAVFLGAWAGGPGNSRVRGAGGGLAAGVAVALKLIQAPTLALVIWRRRWSMLLPAAIGVAAVLGAGLPWLGEYFSAVLPRVGQGTGWVLNQAPAALAARLLHPVSFYRTTPDTGAEVAFAAAVLALIVVGLTVSRLRRRPIGRRDRCVEVALVVAATPVFLPLTWDTHLVLLLLPMIVLAVDSVRRSDVVGVSAALLAWGLTGPLHMVYLVLFQVLLHGSDLRLALSTGHPAAGVDLVLRLGAELGPLGIVVLWLACLRAYSTSYAWSS